ncbi:MAG: recombinase family protein [Clostridiales bacterium]|jgi:site-specific DNA recombinase|nr:recombinase family protein [Clostridiales bacterium]
MASNTTKAWKTAAYIRLSREDADTRSGEKAESESVVNQQQIIGDFIASQPDLGDHLTFIDDGLTGTNFDRPGFQRMMEEIHKGNINCVVVKDLSRFGRNYTEAGVYMEQVFPMLGVRFIAINDHVDSFLRPAEMDSILIPLKNLLNDSYSRDLSIKVRSAMTAKRKRGEFIGGYACYGYLRNPKDKTRLIVDNETADIVRDIFRWYIEGLGKTPIAKRLNALSIPSPAKQRFIRNEREGYPKHEYANRMSWLWSSQTITTILENPTYLGHITQNKRSQVSYKNYKRKKIDKSDWIIVEDTHEPIIDRYTFDRVQELMKLRTKSTLKTGNVYLFSGLLRCADCKRAMERVVVTKKNGKVYVNYRCHTYTAYSHDACTKHTIAEHEIYTAVLQTIQKHTQVLMDFEKVLKKLDYQKHRQSQADRLDKSISKKQQELAEVESIKLGLYTDLKKSIISQDEYVSLKSGYAEKITSLTELIASLREQRQNLEHQEALQNKWLERFKQYQDIESLNRSLVTELIERIDVQEGRQLVIHFKFQDEFEKVRELAEQEVNSLQTAV